MMVPPRTKEDIEKLTELCRPVHEYIRKLKSPYYSITINDEGVHINETIMGIPSSELNKSP